MVLSIDSIEGWEIGEGEKWQTEKDMWREC